MESSISDLFGRLADDGRSFVKAETDLYRMIVLRRAGKAKSGIVAIVVGALLIEAALIVALIGLALALAHLVGPLLGGLIVAAVAGFGGFLLIRYGVGGMKALAGDTEEKAALTAGEKIA